MMRIRLLLALAGILALPGAATVVHYKSPWSDPRAHFDDGSGWTTPPGRAMVHEGGGWWALEIRSASSSVTFNDGAGRWDPGFGRHYAVSGTEVWISGGTIYRRKPDPGRIVPHRGVTSRHLANDRDVWVYLPAGYDDAPGQRYPVLYAHDGNNLFDARAPFGGWQADATLDRMIALEEIEPLILVAVSNTPARMSEYTPTVDPGYGGGGGASYVRFLVEELKPFVDRTYRTRRDRASTGILGSSLGGLISFHAAWERPDVFGLCGAMSPSFWWDGKDLLRRVEGYRGTRPAVRFYLDSGDAGPSQDGRVDTAAMRDALAALGYRMGDDLAHFVDAGAAHNEIAWRERLDRPLAFLFPPRKPAAPGAAETVIRVHHDVGWGHRISLRGTAPGWLAWEKELVATWTAGNVWVYSTTDIPAGVAFEFKVLIDGHHWEVGGNRPARGGQRIEVTPRFP